ncbi:MAG TPA: circadian clock protein KaiC [Acidimicrobiales bacterium]|nr:circadian clock protein KaiC [Acidimicrobiales bacterium]
MLPSGIRGLDNICAGGLPEGEVTLLTGAAGTGKSVLASQFLAVGIRDFAEAGVFVTLDEQPAKTRRFMASLGWDIACWEAAGTWAFLDLSPSDDRELVISEDVDFSLLITRIANAVNRVGAKRVVVDSITNLLTRVGNQPRVRAEVHRLVRSLEQLDVTAVVTAERDHADAARLDVEEFVADNVLILRNTLENGVRRRTVEALKLRGTPHLTGEFPYAIRPGEGVVIASLAELELTHPCSDTRISLGNPDVDDMCHGGAMKDSVILVSGPTGTGKSLLAMEFAAAATDDDGRCLMINFEESAQQLTRNARGWGHDLDALQADGRIRLLCQYPESAPAPTHLIQILRVVDEFQPTRVVVDSISGVQRASSELVFHEFLLGLTSALRARGITSLMTTTTPSLLGGPSASGVEASTLLDMIILLRYMELFGELRRGISILKLRGSDHSKAILEFTITDHGLRMGAPPPAATGILAGQPLIADPSGPGAADTATSDA